MTNVRFSSDGRKLVSVGGADMSVMVWAHSAGSREPPPATDQSEPSAQATPLGYMSEESDTDSEEEGKQTTNKKTYIQTCKWMYVNVYSKFPGGFDSDVEREKKVDYISKTYANPIREASVGGVKPHLQEDKRPTGEQKRPMVSRSAQAVTKVTTIEDKVEVQVSWMEGREGGRDGRTDRGDSQPKRT